MLKNHLSIAITQKLGHSPTASQFKLIGELADFVASDDQNKLFVIKGYAGTGKTTVISALVRFFDELKLKSVLLAPTGRAAKVLSQYAGKPAFTIHKKIYRQLSARDGFGKFVLEKNLHTNTYFIIDEASMIANQQGEISVFGSGRLFDDLVSYLNQGIGCRMIMIGDTAQLPPVGLDISPALDKKFLAGYFMNIRECELTDVVRQSKKSGILENATALRQLISAGQSHYSWTKLSEYTDVSRITGSDIIDRLNAAYEKHGIDQTIVINRSNKQANKYNYGIRSQILGREEEIVPGDMLMVVKNNYYWIRNEKASADFIANGDIIEIEKIIRYYELYGCRFADARVRLPDYGISLETRLLLDTLTAESASLTSEQNKNLFYSIYEDYSDTKPGKKGYNLVRENPFFNAMQVKFAYAVTCHKAQGGQWKSVFIDQGYLRNENIDLEYLRWLYTAMTRATENVYLVNFPGFLFNEY